MKLTDQSYEVISKLDGAQILKNLELAGRVCYKSEELITEDSALKFVAARIKTGHESILEHEKISVRLIFDRGLSHAIVRHRLASYSQESTIFCNYSRDKFDKSVIFIDASDFLTKAQFVVWVNACAYAEKAYLTLTEELHCPVSLARGVLPIAVKTELIMTANLREWRTIFKQRVAGPGDSPMMTKLMRELLDDLKKQIPVVFDDITY